MATRQSKSKSKINSNKSTSLKARKAQRTRTINMVVGASFLGAMGYLVGQGIEKAVAYA